MVDLVPQTVEAHLELARSMAVKYFSEVADQTARGHVVLALMEELGLFEFNADPSTAYTWNALYKLPETSVYGPNGTYSFETNTSQIQYTDTEGGIKAEDSWDGWDADTNMGPNRIRDVMADKTVNLETAIKRTFSESLFTDGTDAANAGKFKGIRTFLKFTAAPATDRVAAPSGSYAGVSCVLGNSGGSWENELAAAEQFIASLSNDWPYNKGRNEYDFNSPLGLNEVSTKWATGNSWNSNCEEIMSFALDNMRIRCGRHRRESGAPFIFLMGQEKFRQFKNYFKARNRIMQPVPEAIELGFPDTFNFEGAWIRTGYEVPADEVYLIAPDMIEFKSPWEKLVRVESGGPWWSKELQKFLYLVKSRGMYHFNPKYAGLIADLSA